MSNKIGFVTTCMIQIAKTVSAREIQRNYRMLFDEVKATKAPLMVMKGSHPEVVILDIESYNQLISKPLHGPVRKGLVPWRTN